jgi:hypothetical protein
MITNFTSDVIASALVQELITRSNGLKVRLCYIVQGFYPRTPHKPLKADSHIACRAHAVPLPALTQRYLKTQL